MAQNAKKQPWSAYKSVLAREFLVYLGFEGSASIIRNFEPLLVPGLLQTEEYAETIIRTYASGEDTQSVVEMRVQARLERQEILMRAEPPQTFFILDEAVIHRWVGGSEVMRQQLEHLKSLGGLPNVSIQILPYEAGAHPGMTGAFVLLEFADPADDDVLYLEDARGDMVTRDDPIDTAEFVNTFWELERISTRPDQLEQVIDRVLREMEASGSGPG